MAKKLTGAEAFFYTHAGYSYDPKKESKDAGRRRTARELAAAEREALERGWFVEWDTDRDVFEEELDEYDAKTAEIAVLRTEDGKVLESLGGIFDPDQATRRVVSAELALEALR